MLDKERCIKEQIYSELLYVFSQCEFEVMQQNSVSCRCESLEVRLLYRKLSGISEEIRQVYSRNSLKYSNDQRGKLD